MAKIKTICLTDLCSQYIIIGVEKQAAGKIFYSRSDLSSTEEDL